MPTPLRWLGLALTLLLLTRSAHAQPKRDLLQEDVSYVNALQYGNTFDAVTLNAAISGIGSAKRVLFLATGAWTLNSNITVPVNITLYIPAGTTVQINAGVTLTLVTIPRYDQPHWFTGLGNLRITDRTWPIDVRLYGATGDGTTDDTASITAALGAAQTDGGTLSFPCGTYLVSSTINIVNTSNLKLLGTGVGSGTTTSACAVLKYTPASGPIFHFDGTVGVELGGLNMTYTNGSYTGSFLRLDQVSGSNPTSEVYIHDSTLQGSNTSSQVATRLVFMDLTNDVTFERVTFAGALEAINGSSIAAANVKNVRIRDCRFQSSIAGFAIRGGGTAWVIEGNRFQPTGVLAGQAFNTTAIGVAGLTYTGNNHTGGNHAATVWMYAQNGPIVGGLISGNIFTDTNASSFCMSLGNSFGLTIVGNYFNCGVSIAGEGSTQVMTIANYHGGPVRFQGFPGALSFTGAQTSSGTGTFRLGMGTFGDAGGKKVLCIDQTTGQLFMSSTSTDCTN